VPGVPIQLESIRKTFGATVAVDQIDLNVPAGDLFFLLGPSGCGKTTLLRMIAGFTEPSGGRIRFGERDVTHLPPNKRNTGMVFQGYALWPHMSVRQNVAFGLGVRKVSRDEQNRRVDEALARVDMTRFADRKPNQLSGGQQQRIALARAIVIEPDVLLLDEPLSNLDAKLRLEMRSQIRSVCKQAGITGVYVTHDQKEALSMADTIAVLRDGRAVQVGPPQTLYRVPKTRFVADFLGETNFLDAELVGQRDGEVLLDTSAGRITSRSFSDDLPATGNVTCSIRPEAIELLHDPKHSHDDPTFNHLDVRPQDTVYLGEVAQHRLALIDSDQTIKAFELNPRPVQMDARVRVAFDPEDVVILED